MPESIGVVKLKAPSDETINSLLELAGLAATLLGGPYAHGAMAIVRVINSFRKDYQIDPEYEKYFESLERLTEARDRRNRLKGGKL